MSYYSANYSASGQLSFLRRKIASAGTMTKKRLPMVVTWFIAHIEAFNLFLLAAPAGVAFGCTDTGQVSA